MPKEPLKILIERTTPLGRLARLYREKKLKKKYVAWQKNQGSGPMPNYGKQQVVIQYIKRFGLKTFIETGTYKGKMVYAVMPFVNNIYSIELDHLHCQRAQERFSGYANVHIIQGQSGEILPKIMTDIKEPCVFWLDAHYSGGSTAKGPLDSPIMQEMDCVLNHCFAGQHVILIDDARCFIGEDGYPNLAEFEQYVAGKNLGLCFQIANDIIRIHKKDSAANE